MSISRTVVLIDDNECRRNEVKLVLEFIGEECEAISSSEWRSMAAKPEGILAVAVGQADDYGDLAEFLTEFQGVSSSVPIVLVGDVTYSGQIDDDLAIQIVGRIDLPLNYNQVLEVLHACQECQGNLSSNLDTNKTLELFRSLVGSSKPIQEIRNLISQVATSEANVLILGESGTGKEVAARNIHFLSKRAEQPFIPVNCGAIPAELLESELFGHEKGAFTGALSARKGRFELAQGGTLFLDEIGDMPLPMQVKILRVLQEKTFERVGGTKTIEADVRIIAATHRNLDEAVKEGSFREDLFYRLNVFPLEMPSLRERSDDIPLLINELTARLENYGRDAVRFSATALASLMRHTWPGNVRELANLVERMCILFPYGVVDVNELPEKYQYLEGLEPYEAPKLKAHIEALNEQIENNLPAPDNNGSENQQSNTHALPEDGFSLKEMMSKLEIDYIKQALERNDWIVAKAAELLGMRRTTLVEKMRKYQITRDAE